MPGTARWMSALSRREVLIRLVVASWVSVVACRHETRPTHLHGVVVDVQIATFTQIQAFTLRTDTGDTHEFVVEGNIGITPGHMREHMLLGDPVIVTVRYEDGLHIATHVEDAAPAAVTP